MSYNIDSVELLVSSLYMDVDDWIRLKDLVDAGTIDSPECHLFEEKQAVQDGRVSITKLWWYGEGSGGTWEVFCREIAPFLKGEATFVLVWEGGDSSDLCHIREGKVYVRPLYDFLKSLFTDLPFENFKWGKPVR